MSRSIARIVTNTPSAPDYLTEIEEMIGAWEMHRSGEFEAFAHRLAEMGKGLTLRTFSETRLAFLRDTLGKRGRFRGTDRTTPENCGGADGSRTLEGVRGAATPCACRGNGTRQCEACREWHRTNLAQLLRRTNRLGEAEPLMRRALEIHESAFGKQHPDRGNLLEQLGGSATRHQPLSKEAEPLMRRALEIDVAAFGEQHPTVATCLNNLATTAAEHQSHRGGRAADAAFAGDPRVRFRQ